MKRTIFHLTGISRRRHLVLLRWFALLVVSLAVLVAGESSGILAAFVVPQKVVTVILPQTLLLVTNAPPPLKAGDLAIQSRLQTLGYTVSVITGSMVLSGDASGKAL